MTPQESIRSDAAQLLDGGRSRLVLGYRARGDWRVDDAKASQGGPV
jgi:hypothetical protein